MQCSIEENKYWNSVSENSWEMKFLEEFVLRLLRKKIKEIPIKTKEFLKGLPKKNPLEFSKKCQNKFPQKFTIIKKV